MSSLTLYAYTNVQHALNARVVAFLNYRLKFKLNVFQSSKVKIKRYH